MQKNISGYMFLGLVLMCTLALTACGKPDRAAADKNFARVCEAVINSTLDEGSSIEVTERKYANEKDKNGKTMRLAMLQTRHATAGGDITIRKYTCFFKESTDWKGYNATFVGFESDGNRVGMFGGEAEGDYTSLINLQDAAEKALKGG